MAISWGMLVNLFILATLWGSAFPGIKLGLTGLSAGNLTLLRFTVASLCFALFLLVTRKRLLPDRRDLPYFFLVGFLGITVYHLALNYGQRFVSAGAASLIIATAPAITAVVAFFLLNDRLSLLGWSGILLSFTGVALIVLGDGGALSLNPFALLILLSALVTAFYTVLQKPLLRRYEAVEVTAFSTWAGTLPLLVFAPGLVADAADAGRTALLAAVYIGVFPAAVAYAQFSYAISRLPVTLATSFLYAVPVFSLLFAWLLLGEVPSALMLVGGAVALSGIVVVGYAKGRAARRAHAVAEPEGV
ncbi:DMT family transporter [Truepera radiovictrix]|uniref:DMT family transporter n=1 Tax=Truepera radiovictrix TaxID=332249 RepID=UPI0002FB5E47|nr:DMT family transporter [Truepera radiovictrix]WMT57741.1 DMT family transporter [Truepera radiovictrix]